MSVTFFHVILAAESEYGGRGGAYDMAVFGICKFFGRYFGNLNKKWSVTVTVKYNI